MPDNEVTTVEKTEALPQAEIVQGGSPIMQMLAHAVQHGQSIEVVRELMAMSKELAADEARRAFEAAMSQAKAEFPVILKTRVVDFSSQKGRTHYKHEDLGEIAKAVDPILGKYGLTYRFKTITENKMVKVTCVVSHRDGHSESNELSAAHDDSGNKNSIQAVGSAITYLQRYTLKAALGLAASNDDDAAKVGQKMDDLLNPEQVANILDLIDKTETDISLFCETFKVEAVPQLTVSNYDSAVRSLNIKLARKLSPEVTK